MVTRSLATLATMNFDPEERFVILETKLAYQERLLEELNQVLIDKSRELDDLQRRLKNIEELARQGDTDRKIPHEPPPHY
jgi:SlyX protein